MSKSKPDREMIRVTKIDYYPHQKDEDAFRKELITILWGINDNGRRVELLVKGCVPRFWSPQNPRDVHIPHRVKRFIVKVEKQGKSYTTDEPLYCIYVKYPYGTIFHELRDCFEVTYQADVFFHEAVRVFYGIEAYITIPRNKYNLHISEITPIDMPIEQIITNDYIFDIETGDKDGFASPTHPTSPVRNQTLLHIQSSKIYHATSTTVKERNINFLLRDKQFLNKAIEHKDGVEIPALSKDATIKIHQSDDGDSEERERDILMWLKEAVQRLGITTICTYNDYDVPYIVNRVHTMNGYIAKWNKKNQGGRKYFPKHIFRAVNVIDIEKVYSKFIYISAGASGRTALQWMGMQEVDYGKIDRVGIDEMYHNNPDMLSIYNIWDCVLPDRVMKHCGELVEKHQALCNYMGCGLDNWDKPMMQWESLIMHRLKNQELLWSVKNIPRDEGMEAGGFVSAEAPMGIYENMIELDNSGEYNAVVMTANMDYKTLVKNKNLVGDRPVAKFPSGRWYYLDVEGLIPVLLKEMTEKIAVYKDEIKRVEKEKDALYKSGAPKEETEVLETRLKILDQLKYIYKSGSLSSTGLQGTGGNTRPFRLAHGGISSDITECARDHIKWNNEFIKRHMYIISENKLVPLLKDEDMFVIKEAAKNNDTEMLINHTPNYINLEYDEDDVLILDVLYNDTDSVKARIEGTLPKFDTDEEMNQFLNRVGDCYAEALNKSFDDFAIQEMGEHITKHHFLIKVDAVYKRYFQWGAKKNYVFKDFNDHIKYVGVKLIKRGTAFVIRDFMKKFFDIVMDDIDNDEIITRIRELMNEYESDIVSGKYTKECGEPRGVHKETLYWDSMIHSNTIFDKEFKMGDVAVFYPASAVVGHPLPKNKQIALEYGDDPADFGVKINYKEVFRKLRVSMEAKKNKEGRMVGILYGIETGATWVSICDNINQKTFDNDALF